MSMRYRPLLTLLAVTVPMASCAAEKTPLPQMTPVTLSEEAGTPSATAVRRKLIRTVDLALRADDPEHLSTEIQRLVGEAGGYVASLNAYASDGGRSYAVTLRVPVATLDGVVERVKRLAGEVVRESLRSEDVTDRYVDLEARLRTLEATEIELLGLLGESRERNQKAQDIMAIYEELTKIRTQIEQLRGQLDLLESQTSFSTLNVEIWPTEAATPIASSAWRPLQTLKRSARTLVMALRGIADLLIFLLVAVAPLAAVVLAPIWLLARWTRRRRRPGGGEEEKEGPPE